LLFATSVTGRTQRSTRPFWLAAAVCSFAAGCNDHVSQSSELFEAAWEENQDSKSDQNDCSGVTVSDQSGFAKRVALTFDDGPNPSTTTEIMKVLRKHQVPATFFINGRRVSSPLASEIVQDIADDPLFVLANHSFSHMNMKELTDSEVISEIERTTRIIADTGERPRYFRFPFGQSSCDTMKRVVERGYISTGWHVDSADWCFEADNGVCTEQTFKHVPKQFREDMVGFTMSQLRTRQGGIVLFHDTLTNTASQIEDIITRMKDDGFTFVSLDDEDTFPLHHGKRSRFIGDECDRDDDCKSFGGFCIPSSEVPGGYCSVGCESSCPDRTGFPVTRCAEAPDAAGATTSLCLIECSGGCRAGLTCRSLATKKGEREVCWR
jgi:peptidoglycan/xylan/chitin deacetylase (PgdA/CDA1 family)